MKKQVILLIFTLISAPSLFSFSPFSFYIKNAADFHNIKSTSYTGINAPNPKLNISKDQLKAYKLNISKNKHTTQNQLKAYVQQYAAFQAIKREITGPESKAQTKSATYNQSKQTAEPLKAQSQSTQTVHENISIGTQADDYQAIPKVQIESATLTQFTQTAEPLKAQSQNAQTVHENKSIGIQTDHNQAIPTELQKLWGKMSKIRNSYSNEFRTHFSQDLADETTRPTTNGLQPNNPLLNSTIYTRLGRLLELYKGFKHDKNRENSQVVFKEIENYLKQMHGQELPLVFNHQQYGIKTVDRNKPLTFFVAENYFDELLPLINQYQPDLINAPYNGQTALTWLKQEQELAKRVLTAKELLQKYKNQMQDNPQSVEEFRPAITSLAQEYRVNFKLSVPTIATSIEKRMEKLEVTQPVRQSLIKQLLKYGAAELNMFN